MARPVRMGGGSLAARQGCLRTSLGARKESKGASRTGTLMGPPPATPGSQQCSLVHLELRGAENDSRGLGCDLVKVPHGQGTLSGPFGG